MHDWYDTPPIMEGLQSEERTVTKETAIAVQSHEEQYPVLAGGAENITEVMQSLAESLGGEKISQFDLSRISVPAGGGAHWSIPDVDDPAGKSEKELIGVVVGQSLGRSYWRQSMDEGGSAPPDCSSNDGLIGQGTPGGSCEECPFSQWGSADKGGGQACKLSRSIFILMPGEALPVVLSVPPSSLQGAKKFLLRLASKGRTLSQVVCKFTLEKAQNAAGTGYSKIVFNAGEALPTEMVKTVKAYEKAFAPSIKR